MIEVLTRSLTEGWPDALMLRPSSQSLEAGGQDEVKPCINLNC